MERSTMMDQLWAFVFFILHVLEVYIEAIYGLFVPPPMRSLTGEIILVTGSAKGLGKAICKHLSQFKVTLVLWDCDKIENENTAAELKELNTKARIFSYHVDISDRTNVEVTAAKVKQDVGDVTIVINNAAIAPIGQFLHTDPSLMEKTFQVNVLAHFWILREFLPRMIENHHGHIATVSSIGALRQVGGSVPYFGSKAAVHGYIESLKLQLARLNTHGVKFTTLYPTFISNTGMLKDVKYAEDSRIFRKIFPFLKAEDVADKLIEGVRRSYEYVYCPWFTPYFVSFDRLLPLKLRRDLHLLFETQINHPNFPKISQRR